MRVNKIEIDLVSLKLKFLTKEGYVLKERQYSTKDALMKAAKQADINLLRALEAEQF